MTVNTTSPPTIDDSLTSFRAGRWEDFIGQETVKKGLEIAISAAKTRQEALEHVLLYGPPGLGKTTLAHLIAQTLGVNLKVTSGPAIERAGDLASILTGLEKGDVLFIDEIHRLNKVIEETLYPAMEDYSLDVILGKGPAAKTLRLDLNPFTLIGATTRIGAVAAPLRDRFGVIYRLNFYKDTELERIIINAAIKINLKLAGESSSLIASRSRRTARVALKLLKRVRDFVQYHKSPIATPDLTVQALDMLEIDQHGLDQIDRKLLHEVIIHHQGGPVGLDTISALIGEDRDTVADVYEPFLLRSGFIKRTPRGRVVTRKAYLHLGLTPPKNQ